MTSVLTSVVLSWPAADGWIWLSRLPAVLSLIAAGHVAGTTLHLPAATVAIAALPFVVQYAVSALRYVLPPTLRSSIAAVPSLICACLLPGTGDVDLDRHLPCWQRWHRW